MESQNPPSAPPEILFAPVAPDAAVLASLQKSFSASAGLILGIVMLPVIAFGVFQYAVPLAMSLVGIVPNPAWGGLPVTLARLTGAAVATSLWWWFLRWRLYTVASNALGRAYQEASEGLRMWLQAQAFWLRKDTLASGWDQQFASYPHVLVGVAVAAAATALGDQAVGEPRVLAVWGLNWAGAVALAVGVLIATSKLLNPGYRRTGVYDWPYKQGALKSAPPVLRIPAWARPGANLFAGPIFFIVALAIQLCSVVAASALTANQQEQRLYDAVIATAKNPKLTTAEKIADLQKQFKNIPAHPESAEAYATGPTVFQAGGDQGAPSNFQNSQCTVLAFDQSTTGSGKPAPQSGLGFCDVELTPASVRPLAQWVATLSSSQVASLVAGSAQ